MSRQIEVLVIGRPSHFRNSIHLLLASISKIEKTNLADDVESASKVTGVPVVVILDTDEGNSRLSETISKIKTTWPLAGLIILVEEELDYQVAQTAGADVLLRKGFPAARFIDAVETLLSR